MSRTPAYVNLPVVRGSTWEDEFIYTADDNVTPINLTGYEARMQVRTEEGSYGSEVAPVLELTTTNGFLVWDTAALGRLLIVVPPDDHAVLNPDNEELVRYGYAVEVYIPAGVAPEYVLPIARGKIKVRGEITR